MAKQKITYAKIKGRVKKKNLKKGKCPFCGK